MYLRGTKELDVSLFSVDYISLFDSPESLSIANACIGPISYLCKNHFKAHGRGYLGHIEKNNNYMLERYCGNKVRSELERFLPGIVQRSD